MKKTGRRAFLKNVIISALGAAGIPATALVSTAWGDPPGGEPVIIPPGGEPVIIPPGGEPVIIPPGGELVIIPPGVEPSLFARIIRGELPCFKLYEDEYTFSLLAPEVINPGHAIVVPRIQIDQFLDVPEPYYSAVFKTAQRVGKAIREVTRCQRVGSLIHGYSTPHFHCHLVPMFSHSDLYCFKPRSLSDQENLDLQSRIVTALRAAAPA